MPGKRLGLTATSKTASGDRETLRDADTRLSKVLPKLAESQTTADFVEASKKYRGALAGVSFERPLGMKFRRRLPLGEM